MVNSYAIYQYATVMTMTFQILGFRGEINKKK